MNDRCTPALKGERQRTMTERILIIEDEIKIAHALKDYFAKHASYEILTAGSADEAVRLARETPLDLIVADVVMPGRDGIEAVEEIRRFIPDVACIVITGFAEESTPIRALKIGVRDYIKKPFDPAELLNSVENLLRLRRLERESQQMRKSLSNFRTQLEEILGMIRSTARLGSSAEPTALLEGILRLGLDLTEAAAGMVLLLDERRKGMRVGAKSGVEEAKVSLAIAEGVAGRVAATGQAICGSGEVVGDGTEADPVRKCMLAVPLEAGEERVGVLEMFDKPSGGFDKRDLALLTSLGRVGGMAISDNRLGVRLKDLLVGALRQAVGSDEQAETADRAIESLQTAMAKLDLSGGQEQAFRIAELIAEIGQQGARELAFCEKMLAEFSELLKSRDVEDVLKRSDLGGRS